MSLILTRTQNMRTNSKIDKYENRLRMHGAFDAFKSQTESPLTFITQEMKDRAMRSIGAPVFETPVIDYDGGVTIGNARTVTIPDSENTSRMVQINFATYAWGFTIAPALYMNNEINIQRDFEVKMLKYINALAKALDDAAVAVLTTEQSQVYSDKLGYTDTAGVINFPWTARMDLLGDLATIMAANDFNTPIDVVGTPGVASLLQKMRQHGAANDVNKQNEYGDKEFFITNNINPAAGKFAGGFAVAEGSIGMLTRFERDCILGTKSNDGHEWDIVNLPILNIPVGTYFYDSVGDYSGIAGAASADMTRTRKEHYGFAVDVAFLTTYNSDPANRANPIIAFDVADADSDAKKFAVPTYTV